MTDRHRFSLMGLVIGILAVTLGTGYAGPITIDLIPPTLKGAAGDVLDYRGTLTNISESTVYLNSAGINVAGYFLPTDLNTLPFFFNAPFFLDPGEATPAIDLFSVHIPAGVPGGFYLGQFTILGGVDAVDLQTVGETRFTAEVARSVPEPATFWLFLLGCGTLVLPQVRRVSGRPPFGLSLRRGRVHRVRP